jgi:probable phosphoglycerate mutase
MKKIPPCIIYFVRHGESLANIEDKVGIHEAPLSPLGKKQAKELNKNLGHVNFSEIFTSNFIRAKGTAEIIALQRKLTIHEDNRLNEWNIGRLDSKMQDVFDQNTYIYFTNDNHMSKKDKFNHRLFPEMETPIEVVDRLTNFIRDKTARHSSENIIAVTHGATLGFLLIYLGFLKFEQMPIFGKLIPNTGYIKITSDQRGVKLTKSTTIISQASRVLKSSQ